MSWPTIRLIWQRELRDQIRDRRTVFMLVILPFVLYPALGILAAQFTAVGAASPIVIAVEGVEHLPAPLGAVRAACAGQVAETAGLSFATALRAAVGTAFAVTAMAEQALREDPALVFQTADGDWRLAPALEETTTAVPLRVRAVLPGEKGAALLRDRQADVLLMVPADFSRRLEDGQPGEVEIAARSDVLSRRAEERLRSILERWQEQLKATRFLREDLSADFDRPLLIRSRSTALERPPDLIAGNLREQMVRLVPFILVLWALAGALYPAVDVCAGEKERGTMETLLISPASREEIVFGKFLAIWVVSAATSLWNLICMGTSAWALTAFFPRVSVPPSAAVWCVLSILPLTAFFSAVCLALGVYARSSKEGQYYLMPLFVVTMPLILITLAPGVELSPFYSLVPVTGVALLMQRLLMRSPDGFPWIYAVPVLAAVVLYSGLALRWAVEQFKREEVLFREAERWELGLWVRRLFREKEARTSVGQALFCFGTLLALRWVFFGQNGQPSAVRQAAAALAFLGPPVFMAALLTRRPMHALGLRRPAGRDTAQALIVAVFATVIVVASTILLDRFLPRARGYLRLPAMGEAGKLTWGILAAQALLPALWQELAFRGFILSGFRGRFAPRPAVILTGCLYGLSFMNAFWFIPAFIAGALLSLVRLSAASVLPAMLIHIAVAAAYGLWNQADTGWLHDQANGLLGLVLMAAVGATGLIVWRMARELALRPERRVEPPPEP